MAQRHLARSLILQVLYSLDFIPGDESHMRMMIQYCVSEFGSTVSEYNFLETVVIGVQKKQHIIDEIIEKAAPQWPIEMMNPVDRNILRMGIYELLFGDYGQVPPKVAINEAVEIAKAFGSDSSRRFVNGVLGAVYREIGEPGKNQDSKKELTPEEYEQLPVDQKAGGIVYSFHDGHIYLAMVHDVFGYWTLSKGSVETGETPEQACIREIKEEIGIDVIVRARLGENEYVANHPENGKVRKHVTYFLTESSYQPLQLESQSGGLVEARWFSVADVVNLRMYDDVTKLITVSLEKLLSEKVA